MEEDIGGEKFKKIDSAHPKRYDEITRITHVDTDKGEYLIISPDLTQGLLTIIPPEGDPIVLEDESLRVYRLCDGTKSVNEIIKILKEGYSDDDSVDGKMKKFIQDLIDEGILCK